MYRKREGRNERLIGYNVVVFHSTGHGSFIDILHSLVHKHMHSLT
jgi:hypothetical protein